MRNKIFKYDFLVVGGGLIGGLTALSLRKKNFKVLVIDDKNEIPIDQRTLAVNANSRDFLEKLGIWSNIKTNPQSIKKIIIKDYINSSPLIFFDQKEAMGNVIYNSELLKIVRQKLIKLKILKTKININLNQLTPNKLIIIDNQKYFFKKIIVSIGKKIISDASQNVISINGGVFSYVGFFKHKKDHKNIAYEIFNKEGPLAILPSPSKNNQKSTFIYSTKEKIACTTIKSLIKRRFSHSHGQIIFQKDIQKFPITPHLTKYNNNYIYVGDSLKSIHPVAGQGWNLGVKDIETLNNLIEQYSIESKIFNPIYHSRRMIESSIYFGFTSFINSLYENQNILNYNVIKIGYLGLQNFTLLRKLFIKQAMGRFNLVG